MVKKVIPKDKINAEAKALQSVDTSTPLENKIFDLPSYKKDGSREGVNHKNPYVVLKYFQKDWECFSNWSKDELAQFSNFLNLFSTHTWDSVYKSSGKGASKAGLGYTPYSVAEMKSGSAFLEKVQQSLSPDIKFFELRITQKIRVHGFQSQAAFFLVLLDRGHRVFPQ
jgi:hypothetical protein